MKMGAPKMGAEQAGAGQMGAMKMGAEQIGVEQAGAMHRRGSGIAQIAIGIAGIGLLLLGIFRGEAAMLMRRAAYI
jgi:hypothetical protein